MALKKILFLLALATIYWRPVYCQQRATKIKLSRRQKHLLRRIAKYNKVEGQNVGRIAIYSEQYARFDSLRRISSAEEMLSFTHYHSPVVKAYAFGALLDSKEITNAFNILQANFQDTTAFQHQFGCIRGAHTIGYYMYYKLILAIKKQGLVLIPEQEVLLREIYEKLPGYEMEEKIIARQIKFD
ncbi:MAG: hypothetical protein EOO61_16350 [Hymenobacter sp.]|nr:MAG: hypothetical protein EOO61_16350 [Hymenobacter sp.]